MDTRKVLGIIFSILFVGAFTFVLCWGIINFNKVKEGMFRGRLLKGERVSLPDDIEGFDDFHLFI